MLEQNKGKYTKDGSHNKTESEEDEVKHSVIKEPRIREVVKRK